MANTYRVDRANSQVCPCGMNSILYIGNSIVAARRAFRNATPGRDAWNAPRPDYGVMLSRWSEARRDYVPLGFKTSESAYLGV